MLETSGFETIARVLKLDHVESLRAALEASQGGDAARQRNGATYAARNLISGISAIRALSKHPAIVRLAEEVCGRAPFVVRSVLFDKTPSANWGVPWHQDLSIAVRERCAAPGFGPWSIKAGVVHVQPPASVLAKIVTLRIHVDNCDADQGALRVIPGSHRGGILSPDQITAVKQSTPCVVCPVKAGGVMLMRPLLLHSSSPATNPSHRRVIHLEFANCDLPGGLEWAERDLTLTGFEP